MWGKFLGNKDIALLRLEWQALQDRISSLEQGQLRLPERVNSLEQWQLEAGPLLQERLGALEQWQQRLEPAILGLAGARDELLDEFQGLVNKIGRDCENVSQRLTLLEQRTAHSFEVETRLAQTERQLTLVSMALSNSQSQLSALNERLAVLEQVDTSQTITQVEQRLEQLQQPLGVLEQRVEQLEQLPVAALEQRVEQLEQLPVAALEQRVEQLEQLPVAALEQRVAQLEQQPDTAQALELLDHRVQLLEQAPDLSRPLHTLGQRIAQLEQAPDPYQAVNELEQRLLQLEPLNQSQQHLGQRLEQLEQAQSRLMPDYSQPLAQLSQRLSQIEQLPDIGQQLSYSEPLPATTSELQLGTVAVDLVNQQLDSLQQRLLQLEQQTADLTPSVEERFQGLQGGLSTLEQQMNERWDSIREAVQDELFTQLQERLDHLEEAHQMLAVRFGDLSRDVEATQTTPAWAEPLEQLRAQLEPLSQLTDLTSRCDELGSSSAQHAQALAELSSMLQQQADSVAQLPQLEQRTLELSSQSAALPELQQRCASLLTATEQQQQTLNSVRAELTQLQQDTHSTHQQQGEQLSSLGERLGQLLNQWPDEIKRIASAHQQLKTVEQQLAGSEKTLREQQQTAVAELRQAVNRNEQRITESNTRQAELAQRLSEELQQQEQDLKAALDKLPSLQTTAQQLEQAQAKLVERIMPIEQTVNNHSQRLGEAEIIINRLDPRFSALETAIKDGDTALQGKLKTLTEDVHNMEEHVIGVANDVTRVDEGLKTLEKRQQNNEAQWQQLLHTQTRLREDLEQRHQDLTTQQQKSTDQLRNFAQKVQVHLHTVHQSLAVLVQGSQQTAEQFQQLDVSLQRLGVRCDGFFSWYRSASGLSRLRGKWAEPDLTDFVPAQRGPAMLNADSTDGVATGTAIVPQSGA